MFNQISKSLRVGVAVLFGVASTVGTIGAADYAVIGASLAAPESAQCDGSCVGSAGNLCGLNGVNYVNYIYCTSGDCSH